MFLPTICSGVVTLPGFSGPFHYISVAEQQPNEFRAVQVLCTPFKLPPPTANAWAAYSRAFFEASKRDPGKLTEAIQAAVNEYVITHVTVQRIGFDHLKRSARVSPYPDGQSVAYVLRHNVTTASYEYIESDWRTCTNCGAEYDDHVDGRCLGRLGEDFLSRAEPYLTGLVRLLKFSDNFPTWITQHADAIYRIALGRFNDEQVTAALPSNNPRGTRITVFGGEAVERAAPAGGGSVDAVPEFTGDNGDR